ncbi:MAG: methylated-DNA--[protein]-cysteine S-methyltransferase [Alphaproteobacteria bacterium]|nr:methylated-DNA--[protein]-cysteine S-methyltransferase [Alphaproteobacteria bacterium]
MKYYSLIQTPFGTAVLSEEDGAIVELSFDAHGCCGMQKETPLLRMAAKQLSEYFSGRRQIFDLPLNPIGTKFQRDVWNALLEIPFGETKSYAQVAAATGRDKAARPVGGAVGKNPIPIIIPCHRVLAANNKIGGFSLGLDMKRKLLKIESILVDN